MQFGRTISVKGGNLDPGGSCVGARDKLAVLEACAKSWREEGFKVAAEWDRERARRLRELMNWPQWSKDG